MFQCENGNSVVLPAAKIPERIVTGSFRGSESDFMRGQLTQNNSNCNFCA